MKSKTLSKIPAFVACWAVLVLLAQSCHVQKSKPAAQNSVSQNPAIGIFPEHVRTTPFQTPEQERQMFDLPPGFEVTLFAAEPDITKPMNIEFDDRGRLWVTQSSEYPIAEGGSDGTDRLTILEDTDGDGRADKFTHFSDSLNIPIGVMPVADGAVAYSVPNLYYFKDKDHDGKPESKSVLLGEFGHKDTHGMVNNLMRGYDGWLHVCHGFSNTSTVAGTDGDSITMTSGNTFRVRLDGSRVEQTTFGRVNPFGFAYDEKGYLYSTDCHTKPITQLIFGGYYPHFGKKAPVGIGFAPAMMSYDLGSTALAGLVYYTGNQFPAEYRHNFYTGDVVTCRIDRTTVTYDGATPTSHKQTPLLVSRDPWFRPVDVKLGPDGAIYVADFYNRIIGHYEVALNHPGRDRTSGRIWKITYVGDQPHEKGIVNDWSKATLPQLIAGLSHPQLNTRLKVADRLVDSWGAKALESVKKLLTDPEPDDDSSVHALWVLHRLGTLEGDFLDKALRSSHSTVRIHAFRVLQERKIMDIKHEPLVLAALSDENPFIRRTAAEVLTRFPKADYLKPLLALHEKTDSADTHLRYTALLGVRQNLHDSRVLWRVPAMSWTEGQLATLTRVMLDVPSSTAAAFVLDYVRNHDLPKAYLVDALEYIGRYAAPYQLKSVIDLVNKKFAADYDTQLSLYQTLQTGIKQSGMAPGPDVEELGTRLARHYLENIDEDTDAWKSRSLVATDRGELPNPWVVSEGYLTNLVPAFRVIYSDNGGLPQRALLRSAPFRIPERLSMNVFDNDLDNRASKMGVSRNAVRIRLSGGDLLVGEYRAEQKQRGVQKDLIKNTTFDLGKYAGQLGYLQVLDSSTIGAIGIGKLEPAVLEIPAKSPATLVDQRVAAAKVAREYKIKSLEPELRKLVKANWLDHQLRSAAAETLMEIDPKANATMLAEVLADRDQLPILREKLAANLGESASPSLLDVLQAQLAGGARSLQVAIATALARTSAGIERLLDAFKEQTANPEIATDLVVKESLARNASPAQRQELASYLASGAQEREARQKLIDQRLTDFKPGSFGLGEGKAVFTQNCSTCHQIDGSGGLVGPQLDGIGNWGRKALTQKILDPNRNITEAFRTYNITLNDGKSLTGLHRRTEGEAMVFADLGGQEFSVAKKDMKEYKPSPYTLMPDQFRHTIPEKEFYSLLDYLLSVK